MTGARAFSMMIQGAVLLALCFAAAPPPTADQGDTSSPPTTKPTEPSESSKAPPIDSLPWPARPGARIINLRAAVPTVSRVVLVPDAATFESAMRQWSLAGRWPILIEDDDFAPMFIRRFKPAEVIRLPAVGTPLPKGEELQRRIIDTAALAWRQPLRRDDSGSNTQTAAGRAENREPAPVRESWEKIGWQPPGVVITSTKDQAWPAALALAADRGEPITFYEDKIGWPDGSIRAADWPNVVSAVQGCVASTGYAYDTLGDVIDTVTIVRDLPVKYRINDNNQDSTRLAVTDGLARHPDNSRWAIVGWIFGDTTRAVYQAMCSIFLNPQSALLYNTYDNSAPWSHYEMQTSAQNLSQMGFAVQHVARPEASARNFERIAPNGLFRDLVFVNTKGNQNWFDTGDGRVYVHDLPILNVPAAVYFIHSWSTFAPGRSGTLAGRWLDRGAYLYVGSVHEPGLVAFLPPGEVFARATSSVPLLVAVRIYNLNPWKVATIGDPLMTMHKPLEPVDPKGFPIDGVDLRESLNSLTQTATQNDTPGAWSKVARECILLGHDEIAVKIYREHLDQRAGADDLLPILPALFVRLDADEFADLCMQIPEPRMTPRAIDLFWLKSLPVLDAWHDKARLLALRQLIRSPLDFSDACHLAPAMSRSDLGGIVSAMLDEAETSANDGYSRQLIAKARRSIR